MNTTKRLVVFWITLLAALGAAATTFFVNVNNPSPVAPYTNWAMAAADIQSAIGAATDGDLILVTNGLYNTGGTVVYGSLTNRVAITKAVTVQSVSGPEATIIQGYRVPQSSKAFSNDVRCVYMTNNAKLVGFTIAGGGTLSLLTGGTIAFSQSQEAGGGVFCESTNAIITNCVLSGNLCPSLYPLAGGGAVFQGTLWNCLLSNNLVSTNIGSYPVEGGAAYGSVLNHCLICSNSASFGGGAANATLNDCEVIGNTALQLGSGCDGGGTYLCTANRCLIAGNLAVSSAGADGGGDYSSRLTECVLSNNLALGITVGGNHGSSAGGGSCQIANGAYTGFLNNCLVVGNSAGGGGGLYMSGSSLATPYAVNCTIVGNTASNDAGGVYAGILQNCVVYGNYCPSVYYGSTSNAYLAILNHCWVNDPLYVDPAAGNYQLQSNSPCINAGNNGFVSLGADLAGNPRIVGGTVDIGAYEFQSPSSILSYAWAQQYGLPTDGSADDLDLDGTGMPNWQKSVADLNPTNPASVLMMLPQETISPSGVNVTWQSVNTRTYYLQRASNLAASPAFSSIHSNLVGQAGVTSFTDTTATNGGPYFYRVGVQ